MQGDLNHYSELVNHDSDIYLGHYGKIIVTIVR